MSDDTIVPAPPGYWAVWVDGHTKRVCRSPVVAFLIDWKNNITLPVLWEPDEDGWDHYLQLPDGRVIGHDRIVYADEAAWRQADAKRYKETLDEEAAA